MNEANKEAMNWKDLDEKDKKILSFVRKKGKVSWTDCEKEFTMTKDQVSKNTRIPRYGWAKGTFVKHWQHVKRFLDIAKDPKTGYHRYKIKAECNDAAEKAVLESDIDQAKLSKVQIPFERFERVAELASRSLNVWREAVEKAANGMRVAEKEIEEDPESPDELEDSAEVGEATERKFFKGIATTGKELLAERKKRGLFSKIKESLKKADLSDSQIELTSWLISMVFEKNLVEQRKKAEFMQIFKDVKIQLACSPGETVPLLTNEDIMSIMNIVVPKAIDENKGKIREKPFRLIISFPDKSQ
jgi:hypothetical protein